MLPNLLDSYISRWSMVLAIVAALASSFVAWKRGTRALAWSWLAVAPLVPLGLYYLLRMPAENYDYTGARGVFSLMLVVLAFCVCMISLSWGVGRKSKRGTT